jgi:YegS/Rv2252/BmrU family lipid kinase
MRFICSHQGGLSRVVLFVVNEGSGNGRGAKVWKKVEAELRKRATEYIKIAVDTPEEAVEQTAAMLKRGSLKAVVVIGGDGSVHSLLPLLAGTGIPFGVIPSGSGNDTARCFGIPRDPIKALDIVLAGQTRLADVLETNADRSEPELTLTAVAVGLDAAVAADVNGSKYKQWCNGLGIGSLAYIIGLLRALGVFAPRPITVTVDGVPHHFPRSWLAAIANVPSYGGGLKICPDARPDDGKLHACVVHGCSVWRLLLVFPTLLNGSHVKLPYVTLLSGDEIRIEAPTAWLAYGDGEPAGQTPVNAAIRAGQLVILTSDSG